MVKERVGSVAYRLQFPVGTKIHDVFHVSQLKKKIGDQETITDWPEFLNENEEARRKPIAILYRQLVKRFGRAGVKVLVQWSNSSPDEASWEFYNNLQKKFPNFCSENP